MRIDVLARAADSTGASNDDRLKQAWETAAMFKKRLVILFVELELRSESRSVGSVGNSDSKSCFEICRWSVSLDQTFFLPHVGPSLFLLLPYLLLFPSSSSCLSPHPCPIRCPAPFTHSICYRFIEHKAELDSIKVQYARIQVRWDHVRCHSKLTTQLHNTTTMRACVYDETDLTRSPRPLHCMFCIFFHLLQRISSIQYCLQS
jgi:hypothetical protein